mmetsp:Transcript_35086/g.67489  ORF Transcript_35086/g.67489 Transcript_35086/m.67489 type:complete len:203 (+) Transcript_35086:180-788(+)
MPTTNEGVKRLLAEASLWPLSRISVSCKQSGCRFCVSPLGCFCKRKPFVHARAVSLGGFRFFGGKRFPLLLECRSPLPDGAASPSVALCATSKYASLSKNCPSRDLLHSSSNECSLGRSPSAQTARIRALLSLPSFSTTSSYASATAECEASARKRPFAMISSTGRESSTILRRKEPVLRAAIAGEGNWQTGCCPTALSEEA